MAAAPEPSGYLLKALLSLEGAESEYAASRYDNCASRCYYAVFQAAIYALQLEGIRPPGRLFVRGEFEGHLIYRRHLYDTQFRRTLQDILELRRKADL